MAADDAFELVPAGIEPLTPDAALELEDDLASQTASPLEIAAPDPPPLGRTPAIDFLAHGFTPTVSGGPLMLTGIPTLAQWVEKCLRTRQGENAACSDDFGVNVMPEDLIDGGALDESALAEAFDDWTEALLVHPRISGVEEWEIDYDAATDYVSVSFRVIPEGTGLDDFLVSNLELPIGG